MKEIEPQLPEAHHVVFTPDQERRLWRKIDLRIVPIISLMYLCCSVDRGNIGNAKLEGMVTQLDLTGDRYNIALTTFFIPYMIFQVPANIVIHYVRPSRWLPILMLLWGLVMMLMGFVKTFSQLAAVRFCLGLAEAGFYPGVAYYLTMWYPKYKLQYRFALFFGTTAVAGAFSGLLAYGIAFMNDAGGLQGWSWIFIIEGLTTIVISFIGAIIFVDYPRTAKFLSIEERQFVEQQQLCDVEDAEEGTIVQHLWMTFTDWQVWALAIVLLSFETPAYGIMFFLPTILQTYPLTTFVLVSLHADP
ncbi:hypothetical protein SCLCIDRAFT_1210483 [Scleroderma citrinum Foug A]|uniref:Major facilitator superfamily (MFS) profile domain-containing protein n=1 Tax=Scleroderma citrinum Foug A TaxID=1036808 RepID=A0A0C3A036_9AGAM|nr:hypothetical protein SCLCIDRAFT_1210483 [Scleroderma citrinum Foug A]